MRIVELWCDRCGASGRIHNQYPDGRWSDGPCPECDATGIVVPVGCDLREVVRDIASDLKSLEDRVFDMQVHLER